MIVILAADLGCRGSKGHPSISGISRRDQWCKDVGKREREIGRGTKAREMERQSKVKLWHVVFLSLSLSTPNHEGKKILGRSKQAKSKKRNKNKERRRILGYFS